MELIQAFGVFPVSSLLCIVLQECQSDSVEPEVKIFIGAVEQKEPKKKEAVSECERNPYNCARWGGWVEISVAEELALCQIKTVDPAQGTEDWFLWSRSWVRGAVTA